MMDRRKALTISLAVDKGDDSMMGNPFKIHKTLLSTPPGCRKVEAQIHWSRLGGHRASLQDAQQEKGAVLGDNSQGALPQCHMLTQPRLVLTDVLTTDVGRTYLHKTRHGQGAKETGRGRGRGAGGRRTRGRPSQYSRETWRGGGGGEEEPGEDWRRCGLTEEGYRDGGEPPGTTRPPGSPDPAALGRCAQNGLKRRASLPAVDPPTGPHQERRRSCHQRASEEEEVVKMVIVGEEGVNGEEQRCSHTRDRDVSESCRSGQERSQGGPLRVQELSPPQLIRAWDTDSGSDAEGNESHELRCNGRLQVGGRGLAGSWSSRRSVLRLSGEARGAGPGPGPGPVEGSAKRLRPDVQDPSEHPGIVMLTTGMEEGAGVSPGPGVRLGVGVGGRRGTLGPNPSLDRTSTPSTAEPIVLSSDDEEPSGGAQKPQSSCSSVLQPLGELAPQGQRPNPQRGNSRMRRTTPKLIRVRVPGFPAPSAPRSNSSSNQALPFTDLYCGGMWAQASADATISAQRITVPLKDGRGQVQVVLQHPGLWRYSVWEQEDLAARGLAWEGPPGACSPPPTLLLLYLSNAQALCVQRQLRKLSVKPGPASTADRPSPFLLLSLCSSLSGVEGALCRSVLDILCLGTWPYQASCSSPQAQAQSPGLSLEESLELITTSETDDQLLLLLCRTDRSEPENQDLVQVLDSVQVGDDQRGDEAPRSDGEKETESHTQLEMDLETYSQASTPASIQASTPASPPASTQASAPASPPASTQASTLASTQASTLAEPQTEPQTELRTESHAGSHAGSQMARLNPEGDRVEAEAAVKEGVSLPRPVYTLCHRRTGDSYYVSLCRKPDDSWTRYRHRGPARSLIQFPPPPTKGGITVAMEDLECLNNGQFLNDVIIDFYLKYLVLERAPSDVADRSHVFSSFFYKQLTRRDNASEDGSSATARQKRHQRVKNWTRHVDIFKKDFLFVPVNQEAHWYLVVICFPGLEEPQSEAWACPASHREPREENSGEPQADQEASGPKKDSTSEAAAPGTGASGSQDRQIGVLESSQTESNVQSPPSPVDCTQQTCHRETVCKRPCILIMDSLRFSLHERVYKLLREYLQSEWEVRRGSERDFSSEQMRGSHCRVPLQDNSSDCGLYLLQFVESFLQDPVVHFDLPLRLELWFPRQQVRRKRDEIRDLVLRLYRLQRDNETLGIVGS